MVSIAGGLDFQRLQRAINAAAGQVGSFVTTLGGNTTQNLSYSYAPREPDPSHR